MDLECIEVSLSSIALSLEKLVKIQEDMFKRNQISIAGLQLSSSLVSRLAHAEIVTIEQLRLCTRSELLALKSIGETSVQQISTALAFYGIQLRSER